MRVDIDNLLTLPVAIFIYKQCLFISVTWSGEACVHLIKLTNEKNDARNKGTNYTNEAQTNRKRKTNERYTQTK